MTRFERQRCNIEVFQPEYFYRYLLATPFLKIMYTVVSLMKGKEKRKDHEWKLWKTNWSSSQTNCNLPSEKARYESREAEIVRWVDFAENWRWWKYWGDSMWFVSNGIVPCINLVTFGKIHWKNRVHSVLFSHATKRKLCADAGAVHNKFSKALILLSWKFRSVKGTFCSMTRFRFFKKPSPTVRKLLTDWSKMC